MGSDESHFNVSVGSDGQSHKTVSTNHNLSEEKGEPKRYQTEVLPLTSLTSHQHSTTDRGPHCPSCVAATPPEVYRRMGQIVGRQPSEGDTAQLLTCPQKETSDLGRLPSERDTAQLTEIHKKRRQIAGRLPSEGVIAQLLEFSDACSESTYPKLLGFLLTTVLVC